MLIRVIDFETTGMPTDPEGAGVCETGYCDVRVEDDIARIDGYPTARLCNPGRPIPVTARAIHHISGSDVFNELPHSDALELLRPAPDEAIIYCAHNADFERAFFEPEAAWICTYKVALRLWPDAPSHSNQVLRYHLGLDLIDAYAMPPHRAGPDAYVTAHLLVHEINDPRRVPIDRMRAWTDSPALLPRVNFGKHKGSKWDDVPSDYLEWIDQKSDLDNDVKANARHQLKKRVYT